MKTNLVALAAFLAFTLNAHAQQEPDRPYIYATYYYCNAATQERADEIVESAWKPIYDKAVDEGTISAWGWLVHHTGGKWRRLSYYVAPTIDALMAAQDSIGEAIDNKTDGSTEFATICGGHDDYIWRSAAGSGDGPASAPRGKASLSVYHVCRMTHEERADEIVKTIIGPVYDAHIGDGKLRSWGWSMHNVGGKYRRLSTMTADSYADLFSARASIFEALDGNVMAEEFSEICTSHSDYLWDIVHEKP